MFHIRYNGGDKCKSNANLTYQSNIIAICDSARKEVSHVPLDLSENFAFLLIFSLYFNLPVRRIVVNTRLFLPRIHSAM